MIAEDYDYIELSVGVTIYNFFIFSQEANLEWIIEKDLIVDSASGAVAPES